MIVHALLWGLLGAATFFAWINYSVGREFDSLRWVVPARLYARPMELYEGATATPESLREMLELLGYAPVEQVTGTGQYHSVATGVELWTRGFRFWDGADRATHLRVSFAGDRVRGIEALGGAAAPPLVRLEPVEIAQFNPLTGRDRILIDSESVPERLVQALISVEDRRFYEHHGIDPVAILRAAYANARAGRIVQGASTLTQQLIKNLYLDRERTWNRKIIEATMSIALELHADKREILDAYLNEVYLGQDGDRAIHGFALAAQHYFGRPLAELATTELALLAGLARGASYYNPFRHPERAIERRDLVLRRMHEDGHIDDGELKRARGAELRLRTRAAGAFGFPAFVELVRKQLAADYGIEQLRTEGLRIFTTLDLRAQQAVEVAAADVLPRLARSEQDPLETAVVVTKVHTGDIVAISGGRQGRYTGFNRVLRAVRPIGSLVKPAVYLAALESGRYHLASVLSDRPLRWVSDDGQSWSPRNYDGEYHGDVMLYEGLAKSLNSATVGLGMDVGLAAVADALRRLGVEQPIRKYPSLMLGAIEMSPLQVTQVYQTIAAGGFRIPLRAVEAVTTADGRPLNRYGIAVAQSIDPQASFLLEYGMRQVFETGTAHSARYALEGSLPLAGKTGTTNDLRDSWFAGFGDNYLAVVWIGHDDNSAIGLTGAAGALKVWQEIARRLPMTARTSMEPEGITWHTVQAGFAAPDSCNGLSMPFLRGVEPPAAAACDDMRPPYRLDADLRAQARPR
jgi:penicillin-binding protein 1B